jgi:hypothetical protein
MHRENSSHMTAKSAAGVAAQSAIIHALLQAMHAS